MKYNFLFIGFFFSSLTAHSGNFTIHGTIEGLPTGSVSLNYKNQADVDTTVNLNFTGGAFSITGAVAEPSEARLSVSGGWSYGTTFFLENSNIHIKLVKDADEKTEISGSVSNITYDKLKPGLNTFFANARANNSAHQQVWPGDNRGQLKVADSLWTVQRGQWMQSIGRAIKENPRNYAALFFIQWLLFKPDDLDGDWALFDQLDATVRNSIAGKKFQEDFEHLHRIAIGQQAPEIVGKDTSGNTVTLAAFKGKVVLLDFWASYCGPCRQENKQSIGIYEKYHPSGFEIVSMSLDNERSLWVKAIVADQLPWPQASELRGGAGASAGVYDISDLPRNVLIGRDGRIIAKDLHGPSLTAVLDGLLMKK